MYIYIYIYTYIHNVSRYYTTIYIYICIHNVSHYHTTLTYSIRYTIYCYVMIIVSHYCITIRWYVMVCDIMLYATIR